MPIAGRLLGRGVSLGMVISELWGQMFNYEGGVLVGIVAFGVFSCWLLLSRGRV